VPGDAFYSSPEWRALRLLALKRARYCCEVCGVSVRKKGASRVDHRLPRRARPDLALVLGNLTVKCAKCDNRGSIWKGEHNRQAHFQEVGVDGLPASWRDDDGEN
jgi:5-methylcytosine-specific restriction endonuclease McrA